MDNVLIKNDGTNDGIVSVNAIPAIKDNYNLSSSNLDVLRLQICKSQFSIDQVTECITVEQDILLKTSRGSTSNSMPWEMTACFSLILVCLILLLYKSKKLKEIFSDE